MKASNSIAPFQTQSRYSLSNIESISLRSPSSRWAKRWNSAWNFLLNALTSRPEPKIRQECDRFGNQYFTVYDPISNQRQTLSSEQEVRIWLEQRYYQ